MSKNTLKPDENGEVTLYGTQHKFNRNQKTVRLYGDDFEIDWGKSTDRSTSKKKSVEPSKPNTSPDEVGQPINDDPQQPVADTVKE